MADKRWKSVERRVAAELNKTLSDVGKFSPFERIPLLGREGPDLTVNETELVINVKSRKVIPARLFPEPKRILYISNLVCFRLEDLGCLAEMPMNSSTDNWKQLSDWLAFMDKWTLEFQPRGISAIILHRPRMPIGHCGVVIHLDNLRRLSSCLTNHSL